MTTRAATGPAPRLGDRPDVIPQRKLRRLLPYFRPYAGRAVVTVLLMLVVTGAGLAIPALAQLGIDDGIDAGDKAMLVLAVGLFVLAGLVGWLAGYYQSYLSSWVGERVLLDLRTDTFRHLMRLELGYHERTPTGRTVSRLTSDIEALEQLVTDGVTSLIINGLTFFGVVAILFAYDAQLALLTFVIFPALAIGTALFRVYSTRAYRRTRERVAEVLATLQETLAGIRVVQGFGRQEPSERVFRRVNDEYREANMLTVRLSGVYFPGVELLAGIGTAIILYFGSTRVLDQDLSVGVMVAFVGYLSSFFDPIQQLSQLYNTFQSAMAALEKIFGVLDTEPELADPPGCAPLPPIAGRVELRGVGFGYGAEPRGARHRPPDRARGDGRAGGLDGRGQVDAGQADRALLRPPGGPGPDRRPRPPRRLDPLAARPARHRPPGGAPLRRHDRREPGLRPAGGDRRRAARRGRRRRRDRVHRGAARGLRHHASTSAARACRPASASSCRSRGRSSPTPASSSSTRPPPPWTCAPSTASTRPCARCSPAAPRSSSRTGSPRSATPTASS